MKTNDEKTLHQNIVYHSDDFKIIVSEGQGSRYAKAFHEDIEIKLFHEGRSMIMIDSEVIIAESGDITIVNPYEIHANIVNDTYNGKYYSLIIDLDFLTDNGTGSIDLRQILLVNHKKINHHIKGNSRLRQILLNVREEMQTQKEYYRTVVANLLCEFFALLLRSELSDSKSSSPKQENIHKGDIIAPALPKNIQRLFLSHND